VNKKTGPLAFDAFPFLVLIQKQNGWERVRDIVDEAANGGFRHLVSLINLGEVYYMMHREYGEELAQKMLDGILDSPFEIINPTFEHMKQAAQWKSGGGLSYADCYAAALAFERGIPLLTGDREFSILEPKGVSVEWLPENR
jgi:predicted nucleic acid-binding protein